MKIKSWLFLLGLGFTVFSLVVFVVATDKTQPQPSFVKAAVTQATIFMVEQTIDFGGLLPTATVSAKAQTGETVLDLLQRTSQIEVKESAYGKFVQSINGISGNGKFWMYYVNGQQATIGAGNFKLEPNQKIEWKLENGV